MPLRLVFSAIRRKFPFHFNHIVSWPASLLPSAACRERNHDGCLQNKPFLVYQNPDFPLHSPIFYKTTDATATSTVRASPSAPLPPVGEGGPGGIGENPVYYRIIF